MPKEFKIGNKVFAIQNYGNMIENLTDLTEDYNQRILYGDEKERK